MIIAHVTAKTRILYRIYVFFSRGGQGQKSDEIVLVQPLHGSCSEGDSQPVEHHTMQQCGRQCHALWHADRHECKCQCGFHTAQAASMNTKVVSMGLEVWPKACNADQNAKPVVTFWNNAPRQLMVS